MPKQRKALTLDCLKCYFGRTLEEAAKELGVCSTVIKNVCRKYGIRRWPYRKIQSINRLIEYLEQQLLEDSKGEKVLGDEKKKRLVNELRRLQRQKDRFQAFPESAGEQDVGDEEPEDDEEEENTLNESKLDYQSNESLGSFDTLERTISTEETQQLFHDSFPVAAASEADVNRTTTDQSPIFQEEPFYHTSTSLSDLGEVKDSQQFHLYSSQYLSDSCLDFQMKGPLVGLQEATQSSTFPSESSYSYRALWDAPERSLPNENMLISDGSSINVFENNNATMKIENRDIDVIESYKPALGDLQLQFRSAASSAQSESVTQEEIFTEMSETSRHSHLNPSQNFAKFLMNLGPQGVEALGPELIVQLAQQYYEETTRSSYFGCQSYEAMEDTLYNIRLLKGRIEDLERECMVLRFQNEVLSNLVASQNNRTNTNQS